MASYESPISDRGVKDIDMTALHTPNGALEICDEVYVRGLMMYDDIVMGSLGGAPVETAYWSVDEEVVALVVRTDKRVEL